LNTYISENYFIEIKELLLRQNVVRVQFFEAQTSAASETMYATNTQTTEHS